MSLDLNPEKKADETVQLLPRATVDVNINIDQFKHDAGEALDDMGDEVVENFRYAYLFLLSKAIPFAFTVFGLFCAASIIIALLDLANEEDFFYEMFGITLIFSVLAAYGVYKWGVVEGQIQSLENQNRFFDQSNEKLRKTRENLSKNVQKLQESIPSIRKSVDELKVHLLAFDDLRKQLATIVGENQDINKMVDSLNEIFNDLQATSLESQKAHLYELYYDLEFKDKQKGLDEMEYERFLGRLPINQRDKFRALGTFKDFAGDDGTLDLNEFQDMISKFLKEMESSGQNLFQN